MQVDRRTFTAGAMAALAASPAMAQRRAAVGWYDRGIIIDGLGGTGDPYTDEGVTRMSDRGWAETVATGVTVIRDTVMPVGNSADPWSDYQKDIAAKKDLVAANPERLLIVKSAADILKAKREKKLGIVLGTQDTCMVGPELNRLKQLKIGRRPDRPADLQQPQSLGRRRAGAGQRRAIEARTSDHRADRSGEDPARS